MELVTVAQAPQKALSPGFRCGSLCQRRNLSEKTESGLGHQAVGMKPSGFPDLCCLEMVYSFRS